VNFAGKNINPQSGFPAPVPIVAELRYHGKNKRKWKKIKHLSQHHPESDRIIPVDKVQDFFE